MLTEYRSTITIRETIRKVKFLPINFENRRVKNINPAINKALKISLLNIFFLSSII